jgi:leucyl-tRNA synthetase
MKTYDHKKIERKWQKEWEKKKVYKAVNNSEKKKHYVLDMFPYPSGVGLHVGHPKGYIGSDVYARMKRMQGYNVLHPMGYDAFGLPAEQYAIEHHINPAQAVAKNVKTFERQLSLIGLSYDWDRRVNTTDPEFYKWTEWIFLKIYGSWYNLDTDKAEPIVKLEEIFARVGNASVRAASGNVEIFSGEEWQKKTPKEKQDILMKYRLAYEGYAEVNWCPELGTVLANDEVVDGPNGPVSERGGFPVEKKEMRQWFMRITAYAERLLSGLEGLNWSSHIKEIQKNWIGRSEGLIFSAKVSDSDMVIKTFSAHFEACYADTFFAIAPDHPLLPKLLEGIKDKDAILKKAKEIADRRDSGNKEVEGIFTGRYAIDPLGNGDLPIWVASFALKDYGTGIVKCSAHDERDFAFANKYGIKLKEVIIPKVVDSKNPPRSDKRTVERNAVQAIVIDPKTQQVLSLKWKNFPWSTFIVGGVENGEDMVEAARREVQEETGYKNLKYLRTLGGAVESHFFAAHKDENRKALFHALVFELENEEKTEVTQDEKKLHEPFWTTWEDLGKDENLACSEFTIWTERFFNKPKPILNGILTEPKEFAGREVKDVREEIAEYVVKKGFAERKVSYKMRDAIFARQRYWGEPIPLIHTKEGLVKEVPEKDLPLKLPKVSSYQPTGTGESPLATVPAWVKKGYETNTMPGWAGSSWYFLRYMDPKNKKAFADKSAIEYWQNVDMYVGGAEHATGHLLYSRFWHKFLKDYDLVVTEEPFQTLRNQGMIQGSDNRKMSKRWGNVINPDDVISIHGADTLRVYEMFMGPFEASLPWSTDNIVGSRRFLERVWKLALKISEQEENILVRKLLHKSIKKVSEDIENFSFNTSISTMMILLNEMEKNTAIPKEDFELFLKILSPFAPHISEEIWHLFGHKTLLVEEAWPEYDPKIIVDDEVKIAVQVNGKVRDEIMIGISLSEDDIKEKALALPAVIKYMAGGQPKKVIYVKGRLINIVL